jgi:hypothetical protein
VKLTTILQLAPAFTFDPQVFVCVKSGLPLIPVNVSAAVPVLVRTTVCGGLVVFFSCVPKVKLVGESVTDGLPAKAGMTKRKIRLGAIHRLARALRRKEGRQKLSFRGRQRKILRIWGKTNLYGIGVGAERRGEPNGTTIAPSKSLLFLLLGCQNAGAEVTPQIGEFTADFQPSVSACEAM